MDVKNVLGTDSVLNFYMSELQMMQKQSTLGHFLCLILIV